jgi:hypothetical protein
MTGQIDSHALSTLILDIFDSDVEIVLDRIFMATGFAGGYNAKWGLPLQQNQTVAAGSLIVLRAKAAIPHDKISQIETDGIGERLTEGFGRLIVEYLPTKQPTVRQFVIPSSLSRPKSAPPKIVMTIQERILRQKLVQAIEAIAAREAGAATEIPPNSLIGRLRFPLRVGQSGLEQMRVWLGDGDGQLRKPALRHLTKCRMGEKRISLDRWLLDRLEADDKMLSSAILDTALRFFVIDRESAEKLLSSQAEEFAHALIDMALGFLSKAASYPDDSSMAEPQEVVQ